jgi:hypothetical protein
MLLGPVLVTVLPARTPNWAAVPRPTGGSAAPAPPANNTMVDAIKAVTAAPHPRMRANRLLFRDPYFRSRIVPVEPMRAPSWRRDQSADATLETLLFDHTAGVRDAGVTHRNNRIIGADENLNIY